MVDKLDTGFDFLYFCGSFSSFLPRFHKYCPLFCYILATEKGPVEFKLCEYENFWCSFLNNPLNVKLLYVLQSADRYICLSFDIVLFDLFQEYQAMNNVSLEGSSCHLFF